MEWEQMVSDWNEDSRERVEWNGDRIQSEMRREEMRWK